MNKDFATIQNPNMVVMIAMELRQNPLNVIQVCISKKILKVLQNDNCFVKIASYNSFFQLMVNGKSMGIGQLVQKIVCNMQKESAQSPNLVEEIAKEMPKNNSFAVMVNAKVNNFID